MAAWSVNKACFIQLLCRFHNFIKSKICCAFAAPHLKETLGTRKGARWVEKGVHTQTGHIRYSKAAWVGFGSIMADPNRRFENDVIYENAIICYVIIIFCVKRFFRPARHVGRIGIHAHSYEKYVFSETDVLGVPVTAVTSFLTQNIYLALVFFGMENLKCCLERFLQSKSAWSRLSSSGCFASGTAIPTMTSGTGRFVY